MGGYIFLFFLVVLAIAKCGGDEVSSSSQTVSATAIDTAQTGPAAAETKPAKVEAGAILQAAADAERALGAFSASGARLYSENCYAFLDASYSSATRDRCLAFDLIAARATSAMGDLAELAWFEEAAVRSRFVNASLSQGDTPAAAELHFASVSNLAQGMSVTPVAPPDAVVEIAEAPKAETITFASDTASADAGDTNVMDRDEVLQEISTLADTDSANEADIPEVR